MVLKGCKNIIYSVQEDPDTVIFKGRAVFRIRHNKDHWSEAMINPTWRQAALWAETIVEETKDLHHVFLEGAILTASLPPRDTSLAIIELSLGS